ncbi:MAG: hypothetical protein KGL39_52165 [Patescibacteria group bacterium]|nr:hypothetical protein [Patescibacteria group bacterium]
MPTETKDPVGYETKAVEFGEQIKVFFNRIMQAVAWAAVKKEGRETVNPQDMLKAVDITLQMIKDFMAKNPGTQQQILDGLRKIAEQLESPIK